MSSPAIVSAPDPIGPYLDASLAWLHRALRDTMPALGEPDDAAWDLAWPRLALLAETLVGIASGAVIGRVVATLVRTIGSELPPGFGATMQRVLAGLREERRAARGSVERVPYLRDAATRPLGDELAARLHVQLIGACRSAAGALAEMIASVAARHAGDVARIIALLADDPMLATLFGEHLTAGWAAYRASVAGREPALPAGAIGDTWRAWLRRVRGQVPQAPPRRDCIVAIG